MSLPLAHLGHWWSYILYAVPLAVVIGSIILTTCQDRRQRLAAEAGAANRDERSGGRTSGREAD